MQESALHRSFCFILFGADTAIKWMVSPTLTGSIGDEYVYLDGLMFSYGLGCRSTPIPHSCHLTQVCINFGHKNTYYPTLAREFHGFRVWGKFVFRTLELTDTPTNQVKVGYALDQSRSTQSRGPERAHQNNDPSWRSSRTDRRLRDHLRRLIGCIYFLSVG